MAASDSEKNDARDLLRTASLTAKARLDKALTAEDASERDRLIENAWLPLQKLETFLLQQNPKSLEQIALEFETTTDSVLKAVATLIRCNLLMSQIPQSSDAPAAEDPDTRLDLSEFDPYLIAEEVSTAKTLASRIIALAPDKTREICYHYAQSLVESLDLQLRRTADTSINYLSHAIALEPSLEEAYTQLFYALRSGGGFMQNAWDIIAEHRECFPDSALPDYHSALMLYTRRNPRQNDTANASEKFTEGSNVRPGPCDTHPGAFTAGRIAFCTCGN